MTNEMIAKALAKLNEKLTYMKEYEQLVKQFSEMDRRDMVKFYWDKARDEDLQIKGFKDCLKTFGVKVEYDDRTETYRVVEE